MDFYQYIWKGNSTKLKDKLQLIVQVSIQDENEQLQPISYVVRELSQEDGKLNFGTFQDTLKTIDKDAQNNLYVGKINYTVQEWSQ